MSEFHVCSIQEDFFYHSEFISFTSDKFFRLLPPLICPGHERITLLICCQNSPKSVIVCHLSVTEACTATKILTVCRV